LTSLSRISSRTLLIAVVVLNAVDALLSYAAIRAGLAVEGNPVADVLGVPGKIALASVAAWLLYLVRPRALWIPAVALGLVVVYSIAGLVLSSL
jgi:Domain of unknown function (DUF5658)